MISHLGEYISWSVVECLVFLSIKVIFVSSSSPHSFSSSNKDGTEIHCTCSMKNELHTCFIFKSTWSSSFSFDLFFQRLHDHVRSFFFVLWLLIKWKVSLLFFIVHSSPSIDSFCFRWSVSDANDSFITPSTFDASTKNVDVRWLIVLSSDLQSECVRACTLALYGHVVIEALLRAVDLFRCCYSSLIYAYRVIVSFLYFYEIVLA